MKKGLSILLMCVLLTGLCACGQAETPAPEATPSPTASPSPTAMPTAEPTPEPTSEPTPESSPSPTPFPYVKSGETAAYSIMPDPELSDGAKALMYWLLGEGMELAEGFFAEELGESMFSLTADPVKNDIPPATADTRYISLASEAFPADCGLLEALLSRFEAQYGYSVEVYVGSGEALEEYLRSGTAELVLAGTQAGNYLRDRKLVNARYPFVSTEYVPGA